MEAIIVDAATPWMAKMAKENPRYIDKAVKSAGWYMRGEVKEGIAKGAPGGVPFAPFSTITTGRIIERYRGRKGMRPRNLRAPHRPLGRLGGPAVRYKFWPNSHRVQVVWLSRSAQYLGKMQQEGKKTRVTESMRRFFWAIGLKLGKNTRYIRMPGREVVEPEWRQNESYIPRYMEEKIWGYMEGLQ